MRYTRIAAGFTGLFLSCFAQVHITKAQTPGSLSQPDISKPGSQPFSNKASNTAGSANAPEIAPALPVPALDENASAEQLLRAARTAIVRGQTGEAQEAMERAQTRLLDRSVPLFKTDQPSRHPAIPLIQQALKALGEGDRTEAVKYVEQALPLAQPAKE